MATIVDFRLLKARPSTMSSSSSEPMSTTPLFFSRGAGGGEALTIAKGTAAMGTGEVGGGAAYGEVGVGVV